MEDAAGPLIITPLCYSQLGWPPNEGFIFYLAENSVDGFIKHDGDGSANS